jgi:hypothetical protein
VARFPRPAGDFWITDLKSELDTASRFAEAGFDPVPDGVVRLRLFLLYDFLWSRGLLRERLAAGLEHVTSEAALWNRHLTDDGYYFLQQFLPRWQRRLLKHTTEAKERAFLEKWYRQFAASETA